MLSSLTGTIERITEKSHIDCFVSCVLELLNAYFKLIKDDEAEEINYQ